jgi:predicted  nucleic acid-binding Zn-ribbon protein
MAKDNHRKHQQLMQELTILNIRIRGHKAHMKKIKGMLSSHDWEDLVRDLKVLNGKKDALNHKISQLKGY